jgi:outer membrane receptor for ferrienterochelin and colicin
MNAKKLFGFVCLGLCFVSAVAAKETQALKMGTLTGRIFDKATGDDAVLVTLTLKNRLFERSITVDGNFTMAAIPAGSYQILVIAIGYEPLELTVEVFAEETVDVELPLVRQEVKLSEVVVAPSTFSFFKQPNGSVNYLDRDSIRNTPHLSDDVYRALTTLPGVSNNDVGASFNVRGGQYREVAVSLDGMELYEPFHVKDFSGVFSIIDSEIIGGLELVSGGYTADAGNALSGLLKMQSAEPTERRSSAGVSFSTAQFRTEGTFSEGLGSYVFSGRRGWLDILLGFTDEDEEEEQSESTIAYWDTFGKVTYAFNGDQKLSFQVLAADDTFEESEVEEGEISNIDSGYGNQNYWLTLDSVWTDRLSSRSMLYAGKLEENQDQDSAELNETYDFKFDRDYDFYGFKQDWEFEATQNLLIRSGFDWRTGDASYGWNAISENDTPLVGQARKEESFALNTDGDHLAAYVSGRFRLSDALVAELGLRFDDFEYIDDSPTSPRVNLAYQFPDNSALRVAYGQYHQAQRLFELAVEDGETAFQQQAERATHYTIGYERRLGNDIDFRIEAFRKEIDNPNPYYINLFETINIAPFLADDRVGIFADSAEIDGVELVLKRDTGSKWSWFVNYTWSQADDIIDGVAVARQWDQEHAFTAAVNYRRNRRWNFNAAWTYHTGWRVTPFEFTADPNAENGYTFSLGDLNSEKLSAYHRLDLRINRAIFKDNGRGFNLYIDIQNLYNRGNEAGFEELTVETIDGVPTLTYEKGEWLPILPSVGVNWIF